MQKFAYMHRETHIRHEPQTRFGKNIDIKQNLKEFYDEIKKHNIADIICIDESSISGMLKRKHCYKDSGQKNI